MKETGIIMSGNHPTLILDKKKTMTRRVIIPQPTFNGTDLSGKPYYIWKGKQYSLWAMAKVCPYGQVGDRLWIKQTWRVSNVTSPMSKGIVTIEVKAGNPNVQLTNNEFAYNEQGIWLPVAYTAIRTRKWQSAMFMPKSTASIWLEITEVRAERLQGITEEDARAEGVEFINKLGYAAWRNYIGGENEPLDSAIESFKTLWDSRNAKRGFGWDKNNWVFPISFKLLSG